MSNQSNISSSTPISEIDTEEVLFEKTRLEEFNKSSDFNPYPHKFQTTITFEDYIKKYNDVEKGSRHHELKESVAGRVLEVRNSGKKLFEIKDQNNSSYTSEKNLFHKLL